MGSLTHKQAVILLDKYFELAKKTIPYASYIILQEAYVLLKAKANDKRTSPEKKKAKKAKRNDLPTPTEP